MTQDQIIEDTLMGSKMTAFLKEIETIRRNDGVAYMDAVIHYCEVREVEIESVAKFIRGNAKLKANIREEAEALNFLAKTAKLPF